MIYNWKKVAAALALGSALLMPLGMTSAKDVEVGMPNPLVEYRTYTELTNALDFCPLSMPRGTFLAGKYKSTDYIAISGNVADVRYALENDGNLTIRSAKVGTGTQDISGIYGAKWKEVNYDGVMVTQAKLKDKAYAARWNVGEYTFAVTSEKLKEKEFKKLISVLVDYTEDHYSESYNPYLRKVK